METVIHHIDTIIYTKFDILTDFGGSFTLNIPLFCQQCGQCCREISFPDPNSLDDVIKSLNMDIQLLGKQNGEQKYYSKTLTEICQIKPCIFLQDDLCLIYSLRPLLCREWYPRVKSKCPAYLLHNKISQTLLNNRKYRVGTREMVLIGDMNLNLSYPSVRKLEEIDEHTLIHYYSPPEDEIRPIWELFLTFNPTNHERLIFKTINPVMRLLD
ncbi:MAG: YkgJ family cysteine cluster protein [Candidatus Heimdallarchaeota archaeon]|nr:MAG: YkgJ family cysteine cluster protein [Candidatus Heimdallarchaeota archaeon]